MFSLVVYCYMTPYFDREYSIAMLALSSYIIAKIESKVVQF